jgi:hypothetical protein
MSDMDTLFAALKGSGVKASLFEPVLVSRTLRPLTPEDDLEAHARAGGWLRWRSALWAGDRMVGMPRDRGPAIVGEWVIDAMASARLMPGPDGVADQVCEIRERSAAESEALEAHEVAALREKVRLRGLPAGRIVTRHIFWTINSDDAGALARRFDRLAHHEGPYR